MWVRAPHWSHVRQAKFLLAGVPCGFSWGSPVFAHLQFGLSHMTRNNLESDVKLNFEIGNAMVFLGRRLNRANAGRHLMRNNATGHRSTRKPTISLNPRMPRHRPQSSVPALAILNL